MVLMKKKIKKKPSKERLVVVIKEIKWHSDRIEAVLKTK